MAPSIAERRPGQGLEKVREHLLTSLHLGRLRPGDRVVSVRRLADMTGLNRKTVHRAYRALVEEGLLEARPGAGTYVSPGAGTRERSEDDLIRAVNRCRSEAQMLGLSPVAFADFVQSALNGGLEKLPLAIVECNHEQIEMIGRDVRSGLKAAPRAVVLADLVANPQAALAGAWGVVTTDCHVAEVDQAARSVGTPVYRVALDPDFPHRILRWAKTRDVVVCIKDDRFAKVFTRFLGQLGASPEILARLHHTSPARLRATLRLVEEDPVLIVSPLAERDAASRIPPGVRPVTGHWRLAEGTIERLRATIAFDIARKRAGTHA
jgi:DNA-binding transcriptional regulator YhcF (GntR family)